MKIKRTSFFDVPAAEPNAAEPNAAEPKTAEPKAAEPKAAESRHIRLQLRSDVGTAGRLLMEYGFTELSRQVASIYQSTLRNRFGVCFVGEFNRGKSTMINRLLGHQVLPVSNLPTTALLTRVIWGEHATLTAYRRNGKVLRSGPLNSAAWEGLSADNFGNNEPEGSVTVTVPDAWLHRTRVQIVDTPGAGDLEARRARVIGDALQACDGAVVVVSALSPLSESEHLFLQQRIMAKRVPYVALAISRLDEVPEQQRDIVVTHIMQKLQLWGLKVPVIIPDTMAMPSDKYQSIMGIDSLRRLIEGWQADPRLSEVTENWLAMQVADVLDTAIKALEQQRDVLASSDTERRIKVDEKIAELNAFTDKWQALCQRMTDRAVATYDVFMEKADAMVATIVERLQYECRHAADPAKWFEQDYPYRLKVEMANMSMALESLTTQRLGADLRWFNNEIQQQFRGAGNVDSDINEAPKADFADLNRKAAPELENLHKKRMNYTVGTAACTLAAAIAITATGGLALVATLGVGTAGGLITKKVIGKKVEEQQRTIIAHIGSEVPAAIKQALDESKARIKYLYNNAIMAAHSRQEAWMADARAAIERAAAPDAERAAEMLAQVDARLRGLTDIRNSIVEFIS